MEKRFRTNLSIISLAGVLTTYAWEGAYCDSTMRSLAAVALSCKKKDEVPQVENRQEKKPLALC